MNNKRVRIDRKPYGHNNQYRRNKFYRTSKRHMSIGEQRLLWTAIWLLFIFALCLVFNTTGPLWLLIFWIIGLA